MDCQVQAYVAGSPALDPLFVSARADAYDSECRWIRLPAECDVAGAPLLARAARQIGFVPVRVMESAFGADIRPFTRCLEPWDAAVDTLLAAVERTRHWDLGEFTGLSSEECARFESGLARRGMDSAVFPVRVRVIEGTQTYEQYLETRGRSVNKNQRAYLKRAVRDGFTFRNALAWKDIVRVLDVRKTRLESGTDYTRTPEFRRFFQTLREAMGAAGRLLEVGMFQGDRLVAYQMAFRTGPVLHMYQNAFDPDFADCRPGALALEKAIEQSLGEQPALIDLMNDTDHLSHYSHDVIECDRLVFFSRAMKGQMLATAYRLKNGLRNRRLGFAVIQT